MIWLWVATAIVLDGIVALVGGMLPDRWIVRYRGAMLGFAAGALLASGVGELLPEAIAAEGAVAAASWGAGAMVALGTFEWWSARRGRHGARPIAPLALLGSDALHNIGDGMAIAAAFLVSIRLGVITSAAVLVHELPEELADYALLRVAGFGKRRALLGLAGVQLTAGIGACGTLLASSLMARAQGIILSIAWGLFVYIAAIDLVPELVRTHAWSALAAGLAGAALVLWFS
ncbi:MAG TPA: ZIP family metal transporter [Kofleriaceae bacterium]